MSKQFVIYDSEDRVSLRDSDGKVLVALDLPAPATASFSLDGSHMAYVPGKTVSKLCICDCETKKCVRQFQYSSIYWVRQMVWSPDGVHVATGTYSEYLYIWNYVTGNCLELVGHQNWVRTICYSPDGTHILSGSDDTTARIWDTRTGVCESVLKGHDHYVIHVNYFPDGKHAVTSGWDCQVLVWDLETKKPIATLLTLNLKDVITHTCYLPEYRYLVGLSMSCKVYIWDIDSQTCVKIWTHGRADSLGFAHSGRSIFIAETACALNIPFLSINKILAGKTPTQLSDPRIWQAIRELV